MPARGWSSAHADSYGLPTEAIFIFHNMLRQIGRLRAALYRSHLREPGKTFRDEVFAEYKANRRETPRICHSDPLVDSPARSDADSIIEYPGFEADDVIGTWPLGRGSRVAKW